MTTTLAHLDAAVGAGGEDPAATAWRAAEWRILGLFVGHHLAPDAPLGAAAEFHGQAPTAAHRRALAARLQATLPCPPTRERAALDYLTGAALPWAMTTVAQQRLPLAHFPGGDVAAAARWLAQLAAALETALARGRLVRVPQPVVQTLLASRAGQLVAARAAGGHAMMRSPRPAPSRSTPPMCRWNGRRLAHGIGSFANQTRNCRPWNPNCAPTNRRESRYRPARAGAMGTP
jgi:hypothetical protein